jgi:hypothetical protein
VIWRLTVLQRDFWNYGNESYAWRVWKQETCFTLEQEDIFHEILLPNFRVHPCLSHHNHTLFCQRFIHVNVILRKPTCKLCHSEDVQRAVPWCHVGHCQLSCTNTHQPASAWQLDLSLLLHIFLREVIRKAYLANGKEWRPLRGSWRVVCA